MCGKSGFLSLNFTFRIRIRIPNTDPARQFESGSNRIRDTDSRYLAYYLREEVSGAMASSPVLARVRRAVWAALL